MKTKSYIVTIQVDNEVNCFTSQELQKILEEATSYPVLNIEVMTIDTNRAIL